MHHVITVNSYGGASPKEQTCFVLPCPDLQVNVQTWPTGTRKAPLCYADNITIICSSLDNVQKCCSFLAAPAATWDSNSQLPPKKPCWCWLISEQLTWPYHRLGWYFRLSRGWTTDSPWARFSKGWPLGWPLDFFSWLESPGLTGVPQPNSWPCSTSRQCGLSLIILLTPFRGLVSVEPMPGPASLAVKLMTKTCLCLNGSNQRYDFFPEFPEFSSRGFFVCVKTHPVGVNKIFSPAPWPDIPLITLTLGEPFLVRLARNQQVSIWYQFGRIPDLPKWETNAQLIRPSHLFIKMFVCSGHLDYMLISTYIWQRFICLYYISQ